MPKGTKGFIKDGVPWNKGKKGLQVSWMKGNKGLKPWHNISGFRIRKKGDYKPTKETIEKMIKTKKMHPIRFWLGKKRPNMSGDRHPQWRGGVTPENERLRKSPEYKLWRKAVFERDKYTCIFCGQVGDDLVADHIKPFSLFPELRFAIDNGRTLCDKCHKITDTYGEGAKHYLAKDNN
jgi:5-methylcytosine-specific restriction endonuclease McrA